MRNTIENEYIVVYPEGKITSNNADALKTGIQEILSANPGKKLLIDLDDLEYISSAGLRVLLYYVKQQKGEKLIARNVNPEIYDIFQMTAFDLLMDIKRKLREFSVEGCEIIGQGAVGTVYRVDDDTIVKVYEVPDSLAMIENEQNMAKEAFIKGIPTAISYDMVKVGDKYGSVFELLRATTFNDELIKAPENRDELLRRYAGLLRQIHEVEMDPGVLPEARDVFLGYLDDLKGHMPEDLYGRLRELLSGMQENLHAVHGDIQMKNVMLSEDEPLLIDMDTLSTGDPVFDLQGIYVTYVLFNEDEPDNTEKFLGIPADLSQYVFDRTLEYYFEGKSREELEAARKKISLVGCIRFLYLVAVFNIGLPELIEVRIAHTLDRIRELSGQVDSLEVADKRDRG